MFDHLEKTVKPERAKQTKQVHETCFWKHWDKRPELYAQLAKLSECLVHAFTSKFVAFAFVSTKQIIATPHVVFPTDSRALFGVLQSSLHVFWVELLSTKMGKSVRYTPSDCVQKFPLPLRTDSITSLGDRYYQERAQVMLDKHVGLTDFYNLFHDRGEASADIARLRALHVELDQAVAAAYGWRDLDLGHGFHATKQGERYTLSEPTRRTVLDRLLALNHQRYAEEVKAGLHEKKGGGKRKTKAVPQGTQELDIDCSAPELLNAIFTCAGRREATDRDGFAKEVATALGFQRLRDKTRKVIASGLDSAIRRGLVSCEGQSIVRLAKSYADLEIDTLVKAIAATVRPECVYTPEEVIKHAANYLGCLHLDDSFRESLESALTTAIRRGLITKRGEEIRKV